MTEKSDAMSDAISEHTIPLENQIDELEIDLKESLEKNETLDTMVNQLIDQVRDLDIHIRDLNSEKGCLRIELNKLQGVYK